MKRPSKLSRRTPLARAPMKRTKRPPSETRRIYGTPERVAFVASLPCSVMGCGRGPSENCHAKTGGVGRKADHTLIFPACRVHHAECHQVGVRTWEALHHLDCLALAAHTERLWQHHQRQLQPLSAIVPGVVRAIVEGDQ